MLQLNLDPIFKARGITRPFSYLVKAGFTAHSANYILSSTTKSLRIDLIEMLCVVLVCEPNDLFVWIPDKSKAYPKDHPLYNLQQDDLSDMNETLATIPYKQLKEIHKKINESKEASE
jgi:DNA-binding Xre family transcriptional regulator